MKNHKFRRLHSSISTPDLPHVYRPFAYNVFLQRPNSYRELLFKALPVNMYQSLSTVVDKHLGLDQSATVIQVMDAADVIQPK